jgi:leader peptidase (prepilin peptidase)/N-methyltransferase
VGGRPAGRERRLTGVDPGPIIRAEPLSLHPLPEHSVLHAVVTAWVALVGAAVGSFLNVVIARVPEGESIVRPRSRCPRCGAAIGWRDNLPVLSWLLLRGRCRSCRAPISPRYVMVEVLGAAAALLAYRRHGLSAPAAVELAFAGFLLALAFVDLARWELPPQLTRPLLVLGLAASAVGLAPSPGFARSALGAAVGFGAFWLVRAIGARLSGREAMGEGDLWLLAGIGAYQGIAALVPVVMLASIQGSVVGVALLAAGRLPRGGADDEARRQPDGWVPPRNAVPFGPFLALGALQWLYLARPLARALPLLEVFL